MPDAPSIPPADEAPALTFRERWWRPPAFLSGVGALLALFYLHGETVYPTRELRQDRALLAKMAPRRAVALGSSHAKSILLDKMGLEGVNLAHDGQDLFEVAYIARTVKARSPKLDTVIIGLSYFSFVFDNAAYVERGVKTRTGKRRDLYAAFGRLSFIPGDGAEYAKGMLWPLVTSDHYGAGFKALWLKEARADELDRDDDGGGDDDDEAEGEGQGAPDVDPPATRKRGKSRRSLEAHAKYRCDRYAGLIRNMRSQHPGLLHDTYDLMRDLMLELERDMIHVVLVTPPYFETYNGCFHERWQELTRKNGAQLAQETGSRYLDFSNHPSFRDEAYYSDSDHLRKSQRPRFARALAAALEVPD